MTATDASALLTVRDIRKSFPGVRALRDVELVLHRGEVLALLGENGAGKSTLIKILGGAQPPDGGEIRIDGRLVDLASPVQSQRAGVAIIYQEFNLVPSLSARENIFLGQERSWLSSPRSEAQRARELFARLEVDIDPERPCRELTVAQQQIVEIAKALVLDAQILIMDEPTAALSHQEADKLLAIIRELKAGGLGIIYVSHRLDEVFAVADRVTVFRDGAHVHSGPLGEVTREQLIEIMVGRKIEAEFPRRTSQVGEVGLRVRNLSRGDAVRDVSFDVRRGEVLGIAGLVGAGRTETARLVFGADRREAGTIALDGRPLAIDNPRHAIRAGISMLVEDRKAAGLVLVQSVLDNFALANYRRLSTCGWILRGRLHSRFDEHVNKLSIRITSSQQLARNLSGGNQQKIVLARWLESHAEVIIFDEPTRGVDVGAKYEIYLLINRLAAAGKAIVMISSELPEVLGMSDRILVMRGGRIVAEFDDAGAVTQQQVLAAAMGESGTVESLEQPS